MNTVKRYVPNHEILLLQTVLFLTLEKPTPQQDDGWSCGVRVVWAAGRISNDLPFEDWHVKLNPERMKMEIVEGLRALIEDSVWEAV